MSKQLRQIREFQWISGMEPRNLPFCTFCKQDNKHFFQLMCKEIENLDLETGKYFS